MKKFSIITINRNNSAGLAKTMSSVFAQSSVNYEYIIVDGASSDNSVDVIKNLSAGHQHVIWLSEPDRGIYNAMNKGVDLAKGDYLLFLNSGDKFASNVVLEELENAIGTEDIVIGRVNVVKNGKIVETSHIFSDRTLTLYHIYLWGIPHQAAFIKRKLLVETPYDECLEINSDWKFFVQKIVLDGVKVKNVPNVISDYDGEGLSSKNMDLLLMEREKVFKEMIPERIAADYLSICPHYYEVKRVSWLLQHPCFYRIYRMITSLGMRLAKAQ